MASTACGSAVLRSGGRRLCSSLFSSSAASSRLLRPTHSLRFKPASSRRQPSLIRRFLSSTAVASAPLRAASVSQRLLHPANVSPLPAAVVECAISSRPHPDKAEGEDTYSVHASPEQVTLAIYDGVGSWSFEQGVDVSLFAKRIKQLTDELLLAQSSSSPSSSSSSSSSSSAPSGSAVLPPVALLDSVWRRLSSDRVRGSCTVCIVSLSASSAGCRLDAVTLGDSGFLVLRKRQRGEVETDVTEAVDGDDSRVSVITAYSSAAAAVEQLDDAASHWQPQSPAVPASSASASSSSSPSAQLPYYVHYRSLQQLHYFNCPYQLGFTADGQSESETSSPSASSSSSSSPSSPFDLPESALSTSLSLRADDVVVLSSDGLFDNLDEHTIVSLVSAGLSGEGSSSGGEQSVSELSRSLASAAFDRSVDKRVDGPFAYAAKDHNIMWSGGRKDDITVIVARIAQSEQRQ